MSDFAKLLSHHALAVSCIKDLALEPTEKFCRYSVSAFG